MEPEVLLEKLDEIALGRLDKTSFGALMRLQLYFTGRTQEIMLDFGKRAQGAILKAGGKDGVLDGVKGFGLQAELMRLWGDVIIEWRAELEQLRREAGAIPFGVLAMRHERLIKPVISDQSSVINEAVKEGMFSPQLRLVLDLSSDYLYGDGLNLSGRIWKLDRESRDKINQILMNGISDQRSAWQIAEDLKDLLGANEDCPRWTQYRLYGLTAKEKLKNGAGLLTGKDCDSRGIAYNALRLARTELQKIHGMATDRMMGMQPWVQKEQIHLSAAHPEADICDEVAGGGEDGQGIYDVGTVVLPLHPNCFCYKTAVMMDEGEFTDMMRNWLNGGSWPEMDAYAQALGGDLTGSILKEALGLAVWLYGDKLEDWLK